MRVRPKAATRPVRRDDGMSEEDPAAGGAFVGNCGRPGDAECGMKDMSECSIHGQTGGGVDDTDNDKKLAKMIALAVAKALVAAKIKVAPVRREGDDPEDDNQETGRPDMGAEAEKSFRVGHMHLKAMGDALDVAGDHFDNAMDQFDTVKEALDASPPPDDGEGGGVDAEAEKAARLQKAQARRAKLLALV